MILPCHTVRLLRSLSPPQVSTVVGAALATVVAVVALVVVTLSPCPRSTLLLPRSLTLCRLSAPRWLSEDAGSATKAYRNASLGVTLQRQSAHTVKSVASITRWVWYYGVKRAPEVRVQPQRVAHQFDYSRRRILRCEREELLQSRIGTEEPQLVVQEK